MGISFAQAECILKARRYVELHMIINADCQIDAKKEDHTKYLGLLEAYAKGATTHRVLPAPPRVVPAPRDEDQPNKARPLRVQSQRAVFPWPAPPTPTPRPEGDAQYHDHYPPLASGPKNPKEAEYRKKGDGLQGEEQDDYLGHGYRTGRRCYFEGSPADYRRGDLESFLTCPATSSCLLCDAR